MFDIGAVNASSKLIDKQRLMAYLSPRLLDKVFELGYTATLGDAYRDPRVFGTIGTTKGYGHAKSAHKARLAIDINLFKFGVFLQDSRHHEGLGAFWKSLHPLCRWGGDFERTILEDGIAKKVSAPDGNHYSIEHAGIK